MELQLKQELSFVITNLRNLIAQRKIIELRHFVEQTLIADVAEASANLTSSEVVKLIRWLKPDESADVFTYLEPERRTEVINAFTNAETTQLIDELYVDEIIDLIEDMPANIIPKILKATTSTTRSEVNKILNLLEDSAGSIMTPAQVLLRTNYTVAQSLKLIKTTEDLEFTEYFYVVDEKRLLVGLVSLKNLVFANEQKTIDTLVDKRLATVLINEDQEDVARAFQKYDVNIMPVVSSSGYFHGVITIDDVVDILEEEATEDIQKLAGIEPLATTYFKTSVFKMVRSRTLWLMFLMISATLSQLVLSAFLRVYGADDSNATQQNHLAYVAVVLLVPLLPVISGTSGNAGSQSSTMIVRSLSLQEVRPRDYFKIIWKEFRVGLCCGFILISVNVLRMVIINLAERTPINSETWYTILTLSIALFSTVVISKIVGSSLPVFAKILKLDPAIMAAPLLTTLVDALSTAIFMTSGLLIFS